MRFWSQTTFRVLVVVYIVLGAATLAAYGLGLDQWARYTLTAVGLLVADVVMFYPNPSVVPTTVGGIQWSLILAIVTIFVYLGPLTRELGFVWGIAVLAVWLAIGVGIAALGTSIRERESASAPEPPPPSGKNARPPGASGKR